MTEEKLVKELETILTYSDKRLFGDEPKKKFIEFTKIYHPDKWIKSSYYSQVSSLFTRLSSRLDNIGKDLGFVSSGTNKYQLEELVATGDFSSVYLSNTGTKLVKVSHGPALSPKYPEPQALPTRQLLPKVSRPSNKNKLSEV